VGWTILRGPGFPSGIFGPFEGHYKLNNDFTQKALVYLPFLSRAARRKKESRMENFLDTDWKKKEVLSGEGGGSAEVSIPPLTFI